MTTKINKEVKLYYKLLIVKFHTKMSNGTKVIIRTRQNRDNFSTSVTSTFDLKPPKAIPTLYNISRYYLWSFIAEYQMLLKFSSGQGKFGQKMPMFWPLWPWPLTYNLQNQYQPCTILVDTICEVSYLNIKCYSSYHPDKAKSAQKWQC